MMKVKLSGFDEARDLLKGLNNDVVTRKVLMSAERDMLKPVADEMKTKLASKTQKVTGNLMESIGVRALRGGGKFRTTSLAGVRLNGKFKGYHGHIIDRGTKERSFKQERLIRFKNKAGKEIVARSFGSGRVTATHFAESTIAANRQKVLDQFQNSVVKMLERYISRKAKKIA